MPEDITQIKLKFSFSKPAGMVKWIQCLMLTFMLLGFINSNAIAQSNKNTDTTKGIIAEPDEQDAEFPDGKQAFIDFIKKTLRYNGPAKGRVILQFIVETDGSLTNINIVKSTGTVDDEARKDAVRVIKLSPRWKPGTQNGKLLRQQYTLPITFPNTK
jgi:TonB family protein